MVRTQIKQLFITMLSGQAPTQIRKGYENSKTAMDICMRVKYNRSEELFVSAPD